jgi:hypothetical protein
MKYTQGTPKKIRRSKAKLLSILLLTFVMGTMVSSPVKADWDDRGRGPEWRHREWDDHARDSRHWRHDHPQYVSGYVSSPPVVYAPPPPSGINLILPINIH